MRELNANMLYFAKGGMILDGRPESSNVTDLRGNDQGLILMLMVRVGCTAPPQ